MGAEAEEMNKQGVAEGGAPVANGKVSDDEEKKRPAGSEAASKPVGGKVQNGGLPDDDIASRLAAASEKLQVARKKDEKKRKKGLARYIGALYPKRLLCKLRDVYVNACVMAAEKGDLADLVAGHPGMYYGETVMSRQISQRRDRDHDEMLQASLSRQVSISLSRQYSQQNSGPLKMVRNTSTGISGLSHQGSGAIPGFSRQGSGAIPGLSRQGSTAVPGLGHQASTGISGLNRQTSTGIGGLYRNPSTGIAGLSRNPSTGMPWPNSKPSTGGLGLQRLASGRKSFSRNSSSRNESNLFSGGREKFLQQQATDFLTPKPGQLNLHRSVKVTSVPETEVVKSDRV